MMIIGSRQLALSHLSGRARRRGPVPDGSGIVSVLPVAGLNRRLAAPDHGFSLICMDWVSAVTALSQPVSSAAVGASS
jgi:hypothetical protein